MLGACFVQWDADAVDMTQGKPMLVSNSSLLEEPGQVSTLFTDKTGTLTSNQMKFKSFYVTGDQAYTDCLFESIQSQHSFSELLHAVCLANDVSQNVVDGHVEYFGQSPDEVELVEAASERFGYTLYKESDS